MITLLNMIFANPIAYLIFPNMVNTYNTSTTTEYAVYSGYLNLYKDNKLVKLFTGTSTIDLSDVSGRIRFDNVTDTHSAVVGEWDLAKSQDLVMEDNIRQAMVLWYDIAKQGATNESMAAAPTLRDLSGNGHDATCYNFAWTEQSGINTTAYPNAIVSDGVDDYCLVEGLPLLNKEDGYTVIAKRKYIDDIGIGALVSKRIAPGNDYDGAFQVERDYSDKKVCFNFGRMTDISLSDSEVIFQTSSSYNGTDIQEGNAGDNDTLCIFAYNKSANSRNVALYSVLLFDRDLTTEEIEWVKTNLITE